jgi:hypothetical protein
MIKIIGNTVSNKEMKNLNLYLKIKKPYFIKNQSFSKNAIIQKVAINSTI